MTGKVLVLGGTGRLGHAVIGELVKRDTPLEAPSRLEWNLADHATIPELVGLWKPKAIIHVAGFTDVTAAEKPEHHAMAAILNTLVPGALASACAEAAIPFVHVSTDYVFDGTKAKPYVEDDPVHPLQVYGVTKEDGERAALVWPQSLVVRVSTLYGRSGHGRPAYVDAIVAHARSHAAKGGGTVEVVEHPVSSPTFAGDVAPALLDLLDANVKGIVHVVNEGEASRLELARATIELAGFAANVDVKPRPEPAGALKRPDYSVLDTSKLHGVLGRRLPHWRDALARYLGESERS